MTNIKQTIDSLNQEQKRKLMYAFENQLTQYVELPDSRYVGVNTERLKHLNPEQKAGVWSYGTIKK